MKPRNLRVILGENATFLCQFPGTDAAIEWKINNVSLREQTDVNIHTQIKPNVSGDIHALTITALESYNGTTIKCSARLASGQCHEVESSTVNLLIQGD